MKEAIVTLRTIGNIREWVVAKCPYCGGEHRHGAGKVGNDPHSYLGYRLAHCKPTDYGFEGYHLVEAKEAMQ